METLKNLEIGAGTIYMEDHELYEDNSEGRPERGEDPRATKHLVDDYVIEILSAPINAGKSLSCTKNDPKEMLDIVREHTTGTNKDCEEGAETVERYLHSHDNQVGMSGGDRDNKKRVPYPEINADEQSHLKRGGQHPVLRGASKSNIKRDKWMNGLEEAKRVNPTNERGCREHKSSSVGRNYYAKDVKNRKVRQGMQKMALQRWW